MNKAIAKKIGGRELKGLPILVILVGESGTGKTTFVKMMDCGDNWFESSKAMVETLRQRGKPINHDTIHSFARKAYGENPYWQVPNILNALKEKDFLVLDGPRKIEEVKMLIKSHARTLVVRVVSSKEARFKKLQKRDGISPEDFERILRDEANETELGEILLLSDLIIVNNSTIEDIKRQAPEFKKFLRDQITHLKIN